MKTPQETALILHSTEGETAFFRSVIRYRPRGRNRHFSMVGICKDLERELQTVIPSDQIWSLLGSCYNLAILAEMDPDDPVDIDPSKSTLELLAAKDSTFQEFQLPIHPTIPPEQSFLTLVNQRRLEIDNPSLPRSSDSSSISSGRSPAKRSSHNFEVGQTVEDGMESELTEQEDCDEEEEDDDDEEDDHDNEEDEDSAPEQPKNRKSKSQKLRHGSPPNDRSRSIRARAMRARARGRRKR
ncbi:hypothetical protein O181_006400 [Austropuccinia psidii MF-1]|uniref:Uncharacterized protein n=1 Tax=Austropuccinia psidii MF-1 TaxID=1389203 RepID=A0A9Q3BKC2_9BASI|nr:hypothetical protein [Austropuccinia psidii MF-1]